MRVHNVEAEIMMRLNDPFVAFDAGRLGDQHLVLRICRQMAKQTGTRGTELDEREEEGREKDRRIRQAEEEAKSDDPAAIQRAAKKAKKDADANTAAGDIEKSLIRTPAQCDALLQHGKGKELDTLIRGWKAVGKGGAIRTADGTVWRPVFTTKGSGSTGGVIAIDKVKDLKAVIETYQEVIRSACQ